MGLHARATDSRVPETVNQDHSQSTQQEIGLHTQATDSRVPEAVNQDHSKSAPRE